MTESKPNTAQQASGRPVSGLTTQVPAPAGGMQETVTSSPAGELILGFDPSTATTIRPEGSNDLVFELDGGGTVTITDFFVVGDESLPNLQLPDGTVVASADFFEGSDLDMSTAAGATAAPPSGGSDGSGDPLAMTTGVDALDDQGTWYWDWAGRFSDIYEGREFGEAPASGLSIIGMSPAGQGRPEDTNVPDGSATHHLSASGYKLEIDESFMQGGTNNKDLGDPSYTMEFLISVSDDALSGISIGGTAYSVRDLADGVGGDLFTDGPGVFSNAQLFPVGEGKFVLKMDYRQTDAVEHETPGDHGDARPDELANDASVVTIVVNTVSGGHAAITGNVDIIDDVPMVTLAANAQLGTLTVDESFLADGQKPAGDDNPYITATLTTDVIQAQFGEDVYGADGKGAEPRFSFELVTDPAGNTVGSNLYAVDPTFAGSDHKPAYQGAEIMLSQNADGSISGKIGTLEYFRISIDPATGEVTLELKDNIWHGDKTDHDDVATLLGASEEVLFLVKTITDGDGDTVSNRIDLGGEQGVFRFEDDGPKLTLDHARTGTWEGDTQLTDDGQVHLGNSYMTEGSITPNYGADMALGAADDYLEITFNGIRSFEYYDSEGHLVEGNNPVSGTKVVEFTDGKSGPVYTGLGVIEFTRNADDGSISYRYLAKHGLKEDYEELTFVVKDGDGDKAEQSVRVMMDHDVPAGTAYVDEAGLAVLGSHHNGHSASSYEFAVFLPKDTATFSWNVEEINNTVGNAIKADVNGDGVYEEVAWGVDAAGNLVATATVGGQSFTVLTVEPPAVTLDGSGKTVIDLSEDAGGNWETNLTVTLHYPIEHAPGEGYNTSGLYLGFTAESPGENGELMAIPNAVSVAVVDDAPSALLRQITVVEAPPVAEDVYLVMDVSGSIKDASFALGMKALQSLVQKYIDLGIEAKFSLVTFGSNAKIWGNDESPDHLTALEMQAVLDAGIDGKTNAEIAGYWRTGHQFVNTNYDVALDAAQQLITKGLGAGDTSFYNQKVYFISDGAPNIGFDQGYASWKAFIQDHAGPDAGNDRVEVYAVGVGSSVNAATMKSVTADGDDHYIKAGSYSALADKLTELLQPGSVSGNLFGVDIDSNDPTSADLTQVVSVFYKDKAYAAGEEFEVEPGVTLTVQANGNYTITSAKSVNEDTQYDLKYTVRDADGDESTAAIKLIVKDAKPEAFDTVADKLSGEVAGHYENGTMFILDDFAAREGAGDWYYEKATDSSGTLTSGVSFGKTVSGAAFNAAFVDINGDASATPGNSAFVKIDTVKAGSVQTPFDQAILARTGQSIAELVDRPGDQPTAGNYMEQTFDLLAGGNLQFNFLFDRGSGTQVQYTANNTGEHAFAVLLDEYGNKVWGGVIEPNPDSVSDITGGLCTIPVDNGGKYTLIIGCYDAVNVSNLPSLYVDQLAFTPTDTGAVFTGSMIEDASYYGETDTLGDHARLVAVIVGGVEYAVPVDASLSIHGDGSNGLADGDKLTISAGGQYYFQTTRESFDDVDISYVLREPGQHEDGSFDQATGTVYIRSEDYKFADADAPNAHTEGNDVILGNDGGVALYGGDGNDAVYGGAGDDTLDGGSGNDVIYGGAGDDYLFGNDGNDVLFGGAGNDVIRGGLGSDTMEGGAGSDLFVWKSADYDANTDVINDFTLREDRLSFETLFDGQSNVSLKAIQDALGKGQIDISVDANDASLLNLSVNTGTVTQNVEIHLADSALSAEQVNAINLDDDESAKAALLQQMLTGISG